MTFSGPYTNEIMPPQTEPPSDSLVPVLDIFTRDIHLYISDIYIAWSKIIANYLNKLAWGGPRLQPTLVCMIIRFFSCVRWKLAWLLFCRHVGDLGNIGCDMNGVIDHQMKDDNISLHGPHSVVGRSIVVSRLVNMGKTCSIKHVY